MEQMTPEQAKAILNCMAIDMTGALAGIKKSNPMEDVIDQRLSAIDLAISALEKQVPNKPIPNKRGYVDCPHCHSNLEVILDEISDPDYCFICGQAIDWSE